MPLSVLRLQRLNVVAASAVGVIPKMMAAKTKMESLLEVNCMSPPKVALTISTLESIFQTNHALVVGLDKPAPWAVEIENDENSYGNENGEHRVE